MAQWLVFTKADAPKFAKLLMFLFDLPKVGVNIGGGRHVDLSVPPPNPCPLRWPGWTTRPVKWVAKPTNDGSATDEFAVKLTPAIQDAWQAKKSQLTSQQRTWVQNHIDVASNIELVAAWKRDVQAPDGTTTQEVVEADDVEPEA